MGPQIIYREGSYGQLYCCRALQLLNPISQENALMNDPTEYCLTPRFLRKNAEFICRQIDFNTEGRRFKCDQCENWFSAFRYPTALFIIDTNKRGHNGCFGARYVPFSFNEGE